MSAQSSYKPSDMVQSMKVKVSTFTQQFTQTEINNLALGKNNQIHLTNTAMVNHIRNSNLSSLTPSIDITPKYTTLNQQSSDDGDGIPQTQTQTYTYTYGTGSCVLIDPGNGTNLLIPFTTPIPIFPPNFNIFTINAFIYQAGSSASWLDIVNTILVNTFIGGNNAITNGSVTAPQATLTQSNTWLPNEYGSGHSYWYNCSSQSEDYVCQQIVVYAALTSYISTVLQGNMPFMQMINLFTGVESPMWATQGPPYNVGTINFVTTWPFHLNSLSIATYASGPYGPSNNIYQVNYSSNGETIPTILSGVSSIDTNDMLNLFQINLPIALGNPGGSIVSTCSSNPTGIVSLTQINSNTLPNSVVEMNIIASGTTSVTISSYVYTDTVTIPNNPDVTFNVTS
jgi:hypothetical protein